MQREGTDAEHPKPQATDSGHRQRGEQQTAPKTDAGKQHETPACYRRTEWRLATQHLQKRRHEWRRPADRSPGRSFDHLLHGVERQVPAVGPRNGRCHSKKTGNGDRCRRKHRRA